VVIRAVRRVICKRKLYFNIYLDADPKTKQWIKENIDKVFGFPNLVRFSWKPCQRALDKHAYPVKWCVLNVALAFVLITVS